jgi:predicted DNA-binding protein (MmcQ/YjbR family)
VEDHREEMQRICVALPGAQLTFPFDESTAVYKVGGKMFALVSLAGAPMLSVKVDPDDGLALRQQHPTLQAGYHLNKRHWLTAMMDDDALPSRLLRELVADSHAIVTASLPRAFREQLLG